MDPRGSDHSDYSRPVPLGSSCTRPAHPPKPPNIVFIFSDDHAYQAISAYNDPRRLIETPNIDRLASEGMRFDRCLVPNSICGPSRATVLTGKYSHIERLLQQHQQPVRRLADHVPQAAAGGRLPDGDHRQVAPGHRPDRLRLLAHPARPGRLLQPADDPQRPAGASTRATSTDIITDFSLDWLKQRDQSKPFLLMCQHKAPHREWEPALRHLGHDGDRRYPEPPTLFDDYSGRGKAEHDQDMTIAKTMNAERPQARRRRTISTPEQRKRLGRLLRAAQRGLPRGQSRRARTWCAGNTSATCTTTSAASRRWMRASAGCSTFLDDEGLADNTIVVYSSDQGFYLGEHGWFDKRWIFEESLRTPLLVRWPGVVKPGQRPTGPRLQPRLRRDVPGRRRPAGPRRDAGPQPRAAA